jgi:hypothetical protein
VICDLAKKNSFSEKGNALWLARDHLEHIFTVYINTNSVGWFVLAAVPSEEQLNNSSLNIIHYCVYNNKIKIPFRTAYCNNSVQYSVQDVSYCTVPGSATVLYR